MGKRPQKNRTTHLHAVHDKGFPKNDDWHPLDDQIDRNRDKKFIKRVKPRTAGQQALMNAIQSHNLSLAIGPAGTGKTYLAISAAVEALEDEKVERIVLSRPAMEAGESIGFLPGDMHEKMAPYLRPPL